MPTNVTPEFKKAKEAYRKAREPAERLTLLKEMDIVRASDLGDNHEHYEVRSEDHVHLVCSICGRVTDVPVPGAFRKAARSEQFTVQQARFEMFGICRSCSAKSSATSKGKRG